jgi:hypothetical protein
MIPVWAQLLIGIGGVTFALALIAHDRMQEVKRELGFDEDGDEW